MLVHPELCNDVRCFCDHEVAAIAERLAQRREPGLWLEVIRERRDSGKLGLEAIVLHGE